LKRFVGDSTLDEALKTLGFADLSSLFRIDMEMEMDMDREMKMEIDEGVVSSCFRGWSFVSDELSHSALVQDIR
jgi:hypothetical protein